MNPIPSQLTFTNRSEVIQNHKKQVGLVAAALPYHYPRSLLGAFDILPVEVWGPPNADTSQGSVHLQPYICSLVRNTLSFFLSGNLDGTDMIMVPHGCDSLQGLGSILMDFLRREQSVIPLYIPRSEHENAVPFLADEFRSVYRILCDITGRSPEQNEIRDVLNRDREADSLLRELHGSRNNFPGTQGEFYRCLRSREFLPTAAFSDLARKALSLISTSQQQRGIPVILSGIVPEPMELFDHLESLGAFVAADDLACCGRRLYRSDKHEDVFMEMAAYILGSAPCSTRGSSVEARIHHVTGLARKTGARGVFFWEIKFCEPELFYLPLLQEALKKEGIPSIVLEVDLNDPYSLQLQTRVEAFLEMIA